MRIVLVCRDADSELATGVGAHVRSVARQLARLGHDVHVVCETVPAHAVGTDAIDWVRVEGPRPDHVYFTDRHGYADRVCDSLRRLHDAEPIDLVEVVDVAGEALTTLRAKRLLGELATTLVVVSHHPWASSARAWDLQQPLSLDPTVDAFTEGYCLAHADVVLSPSRLALSGLGMARRAVHAPPPVPVEAMRDRGRPDPANATTVLHLGTLRPGAGVDAFLQAAERVLRRDARFRFVLRGDDTPTDPFGRSYWEHAARRIPPDLREQIAYEGPVRIGDLCAMPPAGAQCVLPEGMSESPATAALAMAMGYVVTARGASTGGEVLRDAGSLVPAGDPDGLASALLASEADAAGACEMAARAQQLVRADGWTGTHAAELVRLHRAHRAEPRRRSATARPLVSVVVPVRDQGGFLGEALGSVRTSGYRPLEIVVVDDGSTDAGTIRTIDALEEVTVVRQAHRGLPAARNAGIGRCRGRYVLPLDADDRVAPGFIERAVTALEAEPGLSHVTGYVQNFGMFDSVFAPLGHLPDLCLVMDTYARATALFRRDVLARVGGYDESLPATEDWDLYIRLHESGCRSDVLPVVGQQYRRHMGSMTFTMGSAMRVELIQNLVRRHLDVLGPDGVVRLALTLVHLWKTGYEPSASAALLHRDGPNRLLGHGGPAGEPA